MKTLFGSKAAGAGAGAGAAGSGGASASASVSARSGDFAGLGILGTKPAHADIERIRSVVRILLLYAVDFAPILI